MLFKLPFVFALLCKDDVSIKEVEIALQRKMPKSKTVKILFKCYCLCVKCESVSSFEVSGYRESRGVGGGMLGVP